MNRRQLGAILSVFLLVLPAIAADPSGKSGARPKTAINRTNRDVTAADVTGIPKGHRYMWSIIGGSALGAGLGAISSGKGAVKGAFIGGGAASSFYLSKNKRAGGSARPWAWVLGNGALVAGLGWAICDCGGGFGAGALIGGGGTALVQALRPHQKTLTQITGADDQTPPNPPATTQPPQNPPATTQPPQNPPPDQTNNPPQSNPPDQTTTPPQSKPPENELPDKPQPKDFRDLDNPQ